MTRSPLFLLPLTALALSACGYSVADAVEDVTHSEDSGFKNGKTVSTSAATTEAFNKVEGIGPDNIVFVTGDAFTIKAEGDAEAIAKLRYKIEDDAIVIGREKGTWFGKSGKAVTVTITAPRLTAAMLAGSGDFTADKMTGDEVELDIAGSGSMTVGALIARKLKGDIAGAGDLVLAGKVDSADYSIAGSGKVDAAKLSATDAEVSIAGSGNLKLNATGTVDVSIAGSGDVDVIGGAKCTTSKMGSGRVNCS
jgi:Putative auto-transporter adhesin, head GIN domain